MEHKHIFEPVRPNNLRKARMIGTPKPATRRSRRKQLEYVIEYF